MPTPTVSVIVPVHDAAASLQECLDSILAQTHRDLECLCVDDGSRDGSAALLAEAAARDGRVRVITQENGGVSRARNAGLAAARGRYVAFADADDAMEPNLLERALGAARAHDAGMVIFGYWKWFAQKGVLVPGPSYNDEGLYDAPFSFAERPELRFELSTANVWRILWRRDLIEENDLRFCEELCYAEDAAFIWQAESVCPRIVLVHDRLYRYRRDGAGGAGARDRNCDMLHALGHVEAFLRGRGLYDEAAQARMVNSAISQLRHGLRTAVSAREYRAICACFERDWRPFVERNLALAHPANAADYARYARCESPEDYLFDLFERHREALSAEQVNARARLEAAERRHAAALAAEKRRREEQEARARRETEALQARVARLAAERDAAREEVRRIRASRTFRAGKAVMAVPRAVGRALRRS